MNLALVTETYPPEVNGVAMTLSRLTRGLSERGWQVEVIRPRQKDEVREGRILPSENGSSVSQFLVPGLPIPYYKSLRMGLPVRSSLKRHWRQQRPDVVHIATEGPLGWAALSAAEALNLPVTSSFHTNFHQYGGHYGIGTRFVHDLALRYLRWIHNRTRVTLAPTQEMCDQLGGQGFQRLGVLARGVDGVLFSPTRRREELRQTWGAAPGDPVVIYVGRLAAEKNLALAVETFLEFQKSEPRARFVLVGDGPERDGLRVKYPKFNYAGVRRGEDLAAHYASADVFVFPSMTETFGNVVTEALASGLVVMTYDYAAGRQNIRSGENGFTARFGDAVAFRGLATKVLEARERWPVIGRAARVQAETLTWEAIVSRFENELGRAASG